MRMSFLAAIAAVAMSSLVAGQAEAVPSVPKPTDGASALTQVRNGCGFRRHWSPRLRRCVWN
jgi:hypothetical protein